MAQVSFLQCTSPSKWSHPSSVAKIPLYPHFCRKGNFCRMANINYLYEKSLYPAHKPFCDEHSPLSPFRCTIYPLWGKTYLTWGAKSEHGVLKFAEGEKMVSQKKFNRWQIQYVLCESPFCYKFYCLVDCICQQGSEQRRQTCPNKYVPM